MLNPDHGQIYSEALSPPPGFRFTSAVAATYSLDLETLLTFPLHLALFSSEQPKEELLGDAIGLLEALRRTAAGITVFSHAGRALAPAHPHPLYGLLEPLVVEVLPPSPDGSFHPKFWLIRFDAPDASATRLRLIVLSRNLTDDRSWDLVLTLDGEPGGRGRSANGPLAALIAGLPDLALHPLSEERATHVREMAELARRTDWELPAGYDKLNFHALGLRTGRSWIPDWSRRMLVVSPFLSNGALTALLGSTGKGIALISRPEELARIDPGILARFERVLMLTERAEREEGEDATPPRRDGTPSGGLHAKAFIVERGWDTHAYVGSANATSPALINGTNIELVAELIGRRSKVGAAADVLNSDNLGSILTDFRPEDAPEPPDPALEQAEQLLDRVRREIVRCGLRASFARGDSGWTIELDSDKPIPLPSDVAISAWLVTRPDVSAVDAPALAGGLVVQLLPAPVSLLTTFLAFELRSTEQPVAIRFVLSVEGVGLPSAERDAAIVRDVIRNRAGFLRYVMLLLAAAAGEGGTLGSGFGSWQRSTGSRAASDDLPIFETLTRAFCREPERLGSIRRLIEDVGAGQQGEDGEVLVPAEFLELWKVFEAAGVVEEVPSS